MSRAPLPPPDFGTSIHRRTPARRSPSRTNSCLYGKCIKPLGQANLDQWSSNIPETSLSPMICSPLSLNRNLLHRPPRAGSKVRRTYRFSSTTCCAPLTVRTSDDTFVDS